MDDLRDQIPPSTFRIHLYDVISLIFEREHCWKLTAALLKFKHFILTIFLACFGEPPCALAAGRAVPPDEARGDAAEAAGLGDGGPRGEPVGAVRAVGAAPGPRFAVPRQRFSLGAALPAGSWTTCP